MAPRAIEDHHHIKRHASASRHCETEGEAIHNTHLDRRPPDRFAAGAS
jgi:hypothetical protein